MEAKTFKPRDRNYGAPPRNCKVTCKKDNLPHFVEMHLLRLVPT